MRISDWSSDVCSSDLSPVRAAAPPGAFALSRSTISKRRSPSRSLPSSARASARDWGRLPATGGLTSSNGTDTGSPTKRRAEPPRSVHRVKSESARGMSTTIHRPERETRQPERGEERQRGVEGKGESVGGEHGGRRGMKKKQKKK